MGVLIHDSTKFYLSEGLHNAHAMETQAIDLLTRQVARLRDYPEIAERLTVHIEESRTQRSRLEDVLAGMGDQASRWKDFVLGAGGQFAALGHRAASDEIIKYMLANYMFEQFEAASYESLGVIGEVAGHADCVRVAQESMREELAMAAWLRERIPAVTRDFLARADTGIRTDYKTMI
jgi:ferritin-like metal-binding protein YciE